MSGAWRATGALATAATAIAGAALWLALPGPHPAVATPRPAESLPLSRGAAWYSETLDTSAHTIVDPRPTRAPLVLQKWITWQGLEFIKANTPGLPHDPGFFGGGDAEPGFGDWDPINVHTLPGTVAGIMKLLQGGTLTAGGVEGSEQTVARRSPLIWMAELATMLADDPNTPAARDAAFAALQAFPGLEQLGPVTDPQGRSGVAVVERASNLHPFQVATGPGCAGPSGGAGCIGEAAPAGSYELQMIFDPTSRAVLALRTIAVDDIPAARITAGTAIYEVSFVAGKVVAHPPIPPAPRPHPSIQSVPWQLGHISGRRVSVRWESGTCDPELKPRPRLVAAETPTTVTLTVKIHVDRGSPGALCAGVGLGGTLSTTLRHPVDDRRIRHGRVTDRDR